MAQLGSLSSQTEMMSHVMSLVEAFRAFDADNDGLITAAELGGLMGSLGYCASEQEVKAMMQEGDKNRDGLLNIEEFVEMNTREMEMEMGDMATFLKTASDTLEVQGNNTAVTAQELHQVVSDIGIGLSFQDCQEIIASMDVNGDGTVSFEDFKLIVNSLI
ncbi:PREDICTED: probable calcium-binding protein CML29 [Nelumbo nucifera]|uniref:EF-hand domain-containing protein n=2 Tax=Nelumbo nucifera TaxID=4432 RepID=A0A822XWU1_NELNU|nr:PREDICTED: probable calcium-binding protein CML29 [Nelumbo nucifera]DAD24482.1 TPA_asm: hypothetical protein HUJ06_025946 [Nelumbo nucifera]